MSTDRTNPKFAALHSEDGMAMLLTLAILVILTALVSEFSYGVHTTTSALYNWKESQRLSFAARSGMSLAVKSISDLQDFYSYTYPGRIEMPVEGILTDFKGNVMITVEDENSRFNINSIVYSNGMLNTVSYNAFRRLLRNLGLDENIAARIADWIDKDNIPQTGDSEQNAKNAYMDSIDELLLIKGIERPVYEKLLKHVTVYGIGSIDDVRININTASIPVIMSLDDKLTEEIANRIIAERSRTPFTNASEILRVAGLDSQLGQSLMGKISVKASKFRIISAAEENRIKRTLECTAEIRGKTQVIIIYWKET